MPGTFTVAIVGRPNTGKSSLMNRIVGHEHAIVDSESGVTRDRNYAESEWNGRQFYIVDTGGLDPDNNQPLMKAIKEQVDFALDESDAVVLLCDAQCGVMPDDRAILNLLRRYLKTQKLFVAVNKADHPTRDVLYEFYELGMEKLYQVSAVHGHGVADLLDDLVEPFPRFEFDEEATPAGCRIAIAGKPNVGKSSLFNRLIGTPRSIVDDVAGTTRDTIIYEHLHKGKSYTFIDTAGLRRPARNKDAVEQFSVYRTLGAIKRSDLAILVLDAEEGKICYQDKRIAGRIVDSGSGCLIVWNKWDVSRHRDEDWKTVVDATRAEFPLLAFAPVISCSAKTGHRTSKVFEMVDKIQESGHSVIPPERLRTLLFEAVSIQPAPPSKGRAIKLSGLRQLNGPPVVFKVKCNQPDGLHFSYQRYLLNLIRRESGFEGWPVRLEL